ncbi:MAG: hypothetical protein LBR22_07810 [Desulfovibrio sp.]|jgi:hypothetical protein|nr:hypothetical protein [Desulfovibrio sp.]
MIARLRQSLRRIFTIVRKELLVLCFGKTSRLMLIMPPLVQIVVFGWAATMEVRNVDVAVLNHDGGSWSQKVLHGLRGSPTTFRDIRHTQSEKEIGGIVERGEVLVALVFPSDFSARIIRGIPPSCRRSLMAAGPTPPRSSPTTSRTSWMAWPRGPSGTRRATPSCRSWT